MENTLVLFKLTLCCTWTWGPVSVIVVTGTVKGTTADIGSLQVSSEYEFAAHRDSHSATFHRRNLGRNR